MEFLSKFPKDVLKINISEKDVKGSLDFSKFTSLKKINCSKNMINNLINLPSSVKELNCGWNHISKLDNLQTPCIKSKQTYICELLQNNSQIKDVSTQIIFPRCSCSIEKIICNNNLRIEFENLPCSLKKLVCCWNELIKIDNLTNSLQILNCSNNNIISLDNLPTSLQILNCDDDLIGKNQSKYPTLNN